jgi:hypothetical protein
MSWEPDRIVTIRFYFQDDDRAIGRAQFHVPVGLLDSAPNLAQSLLNLLQPLSNCVINRYTISLSVHDNTATTSGPAQAVEVGAFIFTTATANERWVMLIPGIRQGKLATTGDFPGIALDLTDTDVQAFITASTDGIGGVAPIAPWGIDLTALTVAYRQIRPQNLLRSR